MLNECCVLRPAVVWLATPLLVVLILAGCGAPVATESAPPQESPTEESSGADTPADAEAEAVVETVEPDPVQATDSEAEQTEAGETEVEPAEPAVVASEPASCQADDLGLVENEVVPAPREDDWAFGPETAVVTIIEYGDFQ